MGPRIARRVCCVVAAAGVISASALAAAATVTAQFVKPITVAPPLQVTFVYGFVPSPDDVFDFFDFATATGSFDKVILPPLPPGVEWDTAALTTGGPTGVPEPAAGVALLACASTLLLRRRRS